MRKSLCYIASLLSLAIALAACEKIEPDLFDEEACGAYFDYEYATDFDRTLNFSEHIVGHPDTVDVMLKVKLLGNLKEQRRTLAVKTKPVEGYTLADVTIEEVVFGNNEYEKEITVKVCRPKKEDSIHAVCIYLDGSGDIGTGISGKDKMNLFVTETYEKPVIWYNQMNTYLGEWSREKHLFLAQHTGNNHFYTNLYNESSGMYLLDSIITLNVSAVNALLAQEPTDSAAIEVDFPILREDDYPNYTEPYFWKDYESLLGTYRVGKFCRLTLILGNSGTRDLAALFASEAARQKMEEEADNLHKDDVKWMLDEYYSYAQLGYHLSDYKEHCWVKMDNTTPYDVRIPYWWEDPDGLGTAEIVEKYFGEYGDYKYRWMLQTMVTEDEAEHFVAASILPFIKNGDSYAWDQSPIGTKQLWGEERFKECYRIIKAKYDGVKSTSIKNKIGVIPDVPLD